MWNHHPNDALCQVGFKQSAMDDCMCYKNNTTCFYYVDDGIFMGPDSGAINKAIEDIERAGLDIEDKGNI